MALSSWNQRPAALTEQQPPPPTQSLRSTAHLAVGGVVALLVARHSDKLHLLGLLPKLPALPAVLSGLCYVLALLCGLAGWQSLQRLLQAKRQPQWERGLKGPQRKLLGLPPLAEGRAAAPVAAASKAPSPIPPLGPPLRGGKAVVIAASPQEALDQATARRSPYGPSPGGRSAGRASPFGDGQRVTTPQQLQRILDEFEQETQASETEGSPAPEYGYSPLPFYSSQPGSRADGTPPLPVGAAAPTYRPSAVPKGAAALPARADGKPTASTDDSKRRALERLETTQRSVEFGVERLREWMAEHLLKPLVASVDSAHTSVMESAKALGWTGVQLSPLDRAAGKPVAQEADAGGATPGAGNKADDELVVAQMREQLVGRARAQAGLASAQAPADAACLDAVLRYQKLAALLRGEFPAGLLPPVPAGYVAARVRELARGTCVAAFRWNAGGAWGGKPWSADLPTDSALLLYLFAAFLAAPHWAFPQEDPAGAQGGGARALYLGKLPAKPASEYYAVLPMRPPQGHAATGLLGLQLGTDQPYFTVMLRGEAVLTDTGSGALFQGVALFLRHCQLAEGGYVGSRSLQYLQLEGVVETAPPSYLYIAGKRLTRMMFNLW